MSSSKTENSPELELQQADSKALIRELKNEYEIADKLTKEVEEFRDEAGLPPINELRYCGYHTLNFVHDLVIDERETLQELRSAIGHARRAAYEAGEAGILSALTIIAVFQDQYSGVVVSDVVKEWTKILQRCDEIRDQVTEARQTGQDRTNDHAAYMKLFAELSSYCKTLKYSRDELNKKIIDRQKSSKNLMLTTLITLFGILLTVVFGVLPYFSK